MRETEDNGIRIILSFSVITLIKQSGRVGEAALFLCTEEKPRLSSDSIRPKKRGQLSLSVSSRLLSESELCDACSVTLDINAHQVVEKSSSLTDHLEKAPS